MSQYGLTESNYKSEVLSAQVTAANVTAWFYGQRALNNQAYTQADQIVNQFNNGASFAELAQNFSQDQSTKNLGGDLGFVEPDKILPEVANALNNAAAGQIKIIPTRYGIELVFVEDKDNHGPNGGLRLHLRQIFLAGGDFNAWYQQETQNLKVIKIVNL